MTGEEAFGMWAPDDVRWSAWAKPVAFVQADQVPVTEMEAAVDAPRPIPGPLDPTSAVVVDLPGALAVSVGLSLAAEGFRPVPLFNGTSGPAAVIDVAPLARALVTGVDRVRNASLAPDAPPAFLLDSRRYGAGSLPSQGAYDNRWVVLPQDFPSGALLAHGGIRSATVIQQGGLTIARDLAHVLRRWQDIGIEIRVIDLASGQAAATVTVPRPFGFKFVWYATLAMLGLRRSNVGGFGSRVPDQIHRHRYG